MTETLERTLFFIKPSGTEDDKWLKIIPMCLQIDDVKIICSKIFCPMPKELAEELYKEHKGEDHYEPLINSVCCGISIAIVFEGYGVIEKIRTLNGATDPEKAAEGTIRRMFGINKRENAAHASDSKKSSDREIPILFPAL